MKQDLAKARQLLAKGMAGALGDPRKKPGFLQAALALVKDAPTGDAAAVRVTIESEMLLGATYVPGPERTELVERLLTDWLARGVTDREAWNRLATAVHRAGLAIPPAQVPAARRAWATAVHTRAFDGAISQPAPPTTAVAYQQALCELSLGQLERARVCIDIAKRDRHLGADAECLEVELLRAEGKAEEARRLLVEIVERETARKRFSDVHYSQLAASSVLLDLDEPTLRQRLLGAWKRGPMAWTDPAFFELA